MHQEVVHRWAMTASQSRRCGRSKWISCLAVCAVTLAGCGDAQPPLTGGKPISYWVDASRIADAPVRKQAVFKLGNAGPVDPAVLPTLMAALADKEALRVRREAVLALLKMGDDAKQAIPLLLDMRAKDRDPKTTRVRRQGPAKASAQRRFDHTISMASP